MSCSVIAHIICISLALLAISEAKNNITVYAPAASPIASSLDNDVTFPPTTVAHANNVALHSFPLATGGPGRRRRRRMEDVVDEYADEYNENEEYDEEDEYADEEDADEEYNEEDEYDVEDDADEEYNEEDEYADEEEQEEEEDEEEEQEEEEEEDESQSQDNENQSQDQNNEMDDDSVEYDQWYADDPYMPTDDYVLQQMRTQWEEEQLEAMNEENERREAMYSRIREVSMNVVASSMSILGFLSAIFTTSILLYFLRVQSLMRRYNREGVKVLAPILVSDPDIEEEMKKPQADGYNRQYSIGETSDKVQNNDSYSMMTDDESYNQVNSRISSDSGSDGSAALSRLFHDIEEAIKSDVNMEELKEEHQRRHHPLVSTVVSFAGGSVSKTRTISKKKQRFLSKQFRVIVQYDDITYHDEINQESSSIIRKRLLVTGEDIVDSSKPSDASAKKRLLVKLHVLKDEPNSGYPSGDIIRALRCSKWLSFFMHLMVGCALVLFGVVMAQKLLPPALFYVYVGMLLLQVPIMNCFLQKSFTGIISKEYLEDGMSLPYESSKKDVNDEKMMSVLKNGTSFDFV